MSDVAKRRLSDLEPDRVDIVDKPANKQRLLVVKNEDGVTEEVILKSESFTPGEFESTLDTSLEINLESDVLIEKADDNQMRSVNESLRLLRPVARAVDGEARTILVRIIRLLETAFGVTPSNENQSQQPQNQQGEQTQMAKATDNLEEVKEIVTKAVEGFITKADVEELLTTQLDKLVEKLQPKETVEKSVTTEVSDTEAPKEEGAADGMDEKEVVTKSEETPAFDKEGFLAEVKSLIESTLSEDKVKSVVEKSVSTYLSNGNSLSDDGKTHVSKSEDTVTWDNVIPLS